MFFTSQEWVAIILTARVFYENTTQNIYNVLSQNFWHWLMPSHFFFSHFLQWFLHFYIAFFFNSFDFLFSLCFFFSSFFCLSKFVPRFCNFPIYFVCLFILFRFCCPFCRFWIHIFDFNHVHMHRMYIFMCKFLFSQ